MRSLCLAAFIVFGLSVVRANAQIGVYGNFNVSHLADNGTSTSSWLYGPGIGVYYNFLHVGPLAVGTDLRGNFLFGDKQRYRSGLLGLRVGAKAPVLPIRPYAQASVGLGGSKYDTVSVWKRTTATSSLIKSRGVSTGRFSLSWTCALPKSATPT